MKKLKEANRLYEKKIADEVKADRQPKAEERKKEKEAKGKPSCPAVRAARPFEPPTKTTPKVQRDTTPPI